MDFVRPAVDPPRQGIQAPSIYDELLLSCDQRHGGYVTSEERRLAWQSECETLHSNAIQTLKVTCNFIYLEAVVQKILMRVDVLGGGGGENEKTTEAEVNGQYEC